MTGIYDFEMIFRELSNAAFCFSLRDQKAEIHDRGAFKPMQCQQAVENPEAQHLSHLMLDVLKIQNDIGLLRPP